MSEGDVEDNEEDDEEDNTPCSICGCHYHPEEVITNWVLNVKLGYC